MQIFMQSKNYSLQKYATKVKLLHRASFKLLKSISKIDFVTLGS